MSTPNILEDAGWPRWNRDEERDWSASPMQEHSELCDWVGLM